MIRQCLKDIFHELFIAPIIQHNKPYQDIEPDIEPLVNALNTVADIKTLASCRGHLHGRIHAPYVYFKAPLSVAIALHKHLKLRDTTWEIHARFNTEHELCFVVSAPYCDRAIEHYWTRFWFLGIHRQRINNEIRMLTHEVITIHKILIDKKTTDTK